MKVIFLVSLFLVAILGSEGARAREYNPSLLALSESDAKAFLVSDEKTKGDEPTKGPTGSDVRAVLDGKYALTAEQYAEYQACIGKIGLGSTISEYRGEVAKCKAAAQQEGYRLSPDQKESDDSTSQDPRVERDRAWQERRLTK